jgi:hypothetical protein
MWLYMILDGDGWKEEHGHDEPLERRGFWSRRYGNLWINGWTGQVMGGIRNHVQTSRQPPTENQLLAVTQNVN